MCGLDSELQNLLRNVQEAEAALQKVLERQSALAAEAAAPPTREREQLLRAALPVLNAEADKLQDRVAVNLGVRSMFVNWRECTRELEDSKAAVHAAHARVMLDVAALESRYSEAVARYEAAVVDLYAPGLSAETTEANLSVASALQAFVMGPPSASVLRVKHLRYVQEGTARALADEERRAAAVASSVFIGEADALQLRDTLEARRRTARRLLDELHAIEDRLREDAYAEETRMRDEVRGLRERVRTATAESALDTSASSASSGSLWASASAAVEQIRLQAQSALTRRELERRALAGTRASVAVDEERTAGERALLALKESFMAESTAVAAQYRERADAASAQLSNTLSHELEPCLQAEQSKVREDTSHLLQLRRQVEAMEAELARATSYAPSMLGDLSFNGAASDARFRSAAAVSDGLVGLLRDVADASSNKEAATLVFGLLDELLPLVGDVDEATAALEREIAARTR